MLSEKDKSVVIAYASAGMSLDTLYKSFMQFDKKGIESAYEEYLQMNDIKSDDLHSGVSCNCS